MTEETVRRHLQPSFVYTILDIGQDKASPGKGNRHQLEICQAKHALESSRKDNNGCERIIEGGWKIYAGDKFKTHVLWAKESQLVGVREHEVAVLKQIHCLFIVCSCVFAFFCLLGRPPHAFLSAENNTFRSGHPGHGLAILSFFAESQLEAGGLGTEVFIRGLARFTGIINVKLAGGQQVSAFPFVSLIQKLGNPN